MNKIKILLNKFEKSNDSFWSFVLKIVFWVVILAFLMPYLASIFIGVTGSKNLTVNDFILFITAAFIVAYTYETQKMKDEMVRQTNVLKMPVIILCIRNIQDKMVIGKYEDQLEIKRKLDDYLIHVRTEEQKSNFYLTLRNVGNGAAFNIKLKCDTFEFPNYQSYFLAPQKDEQAFVVREIDNKKIENWDVFKNSIFELYCEDISGANHYFKYKIVDLMDKKVEFIKHK